MTKRTYDNLLLLKDAGAMVATAAMQVGGTDRVLDMGPASMGQVRAVIDTSAIDTVTGDETYRVAIQGSTDVGFTTPVDLGSIMVTAAGRTELPFSNVKNGVVYRYVRGHLTVAGNTPSLNATVFIARDTGA